MKNSSISHINRLLQTYYYLLLHFIIPNPRLMLMHQTDSESPAKDTHIDMLIQEDHMQEVEVEQALNLLHA